MKRELARRHSVNMDGRDIGTVVLPEADVKIFLTAGSEIRARRRWLELQERGTPRDWEQLLRETRERDEKDANRTGGPARLPSPGRRTPSCWTPPSWTLPRAWGAS